MKNTFYLAFVYIFFIIGCASPLKLYQGETVKKWEKEVVALEKLDKEEKYSKDAVLFIGSSSIRLWKTIQEDVAPYEPIRRGVGGAQIQDIAYYAERLVYPHEFKAVVIFVANDIVGSNNDKKPEEIVRLLDVLVKKIRKNAPIQPIFWVEVTPTNLRWKVWSQIQEASEAIKKYCATTKNVHFIPTAAAYLNEKGLPKSEYFIIDQLHQNKTGYVVWGNLIKDALDGYFKKG